MNLTNDIVIKSFNNLAKKNIIFEINQRELTKENMKNLPFL